MLFPQPEGPTSMQVEIGLGRYQVTRGHQHVPTNATVSPAATSKLNPSNAASLGRVG